MKPHGHVQPPRWIRHVLRRFLDERTFESCIGDLEEKFRANLASGYAAKAKFQYILEGLGFLRMVRRKRGTSAQTTVNMLSHTLLFFTRLVRKDLSYYVVSLLGLTVSLASFFFIMMFIRDELAFDQFHEKRDRIFRVTTHLRLTDVDYNQATSQFPAAQALTTEIPEVEEAVRIFPQNPFIECGEKKFEEHVILVDGNFFSVFSFPFVLGDPNTALQTPSSIVLTQTTAKKYFGNNNVLGQTLILSGHTLQVTGVISDVPVQSHMKFTAVMPLSFQLNHWKSQTGLEGRENKWYWTGTLTYILLKSPGSAEAARSKLPLIVDKYFPQRYRETGRFELQPLTDIHLKSNLLSELEPGGSILYVQLFSIVAFVIILVSTINLVNLSYFKISSRIHELGIRKFLGQNGARIVAQLAAESLLVGALAFVLAVVVCMSSLSALNLMVAKNLDMWTRPHVMILGAALALICLICTLAVVRPALHYATRSSNDLLTQKFHHPGRSRFRNVLIGLQVCFSFILLVFSFVISSQIDFFKNKDLGFDKENVVVIRLNEDLLKNLEAFKNELRKSSHVVEVSGGIVPGAGCPAWRFVPEGGSYEKPLMMPFASVDHDFLTTMKIRLLSGKNFDPDDHYDSLIPYVINRRAAIELGWMDDPLNRTMEVFAPGTTEIMAKGRVIGVMDDYHFESLHLPVKPIVLTVGPFYDEALVRVSASSPEEGTLHLEATWKKFSSKPFEYEVLDRQLETLYNNESKLSNVILFFTFIALYLTCYGMFAMSSLLFSSRLKEVAIRKVLGADQFAIIGQFYSKYAAFNLAAIIVGVPVAIWLGNLWLETFQYRIDLTSSIFVKAAICILLAGLLSVTYYLARVAFSNPVRFLRSE